MDVATQRLVWQRAGDRCEYCGLARDDFPMAPFHIEHIIPKKHGGPDDPDHLALACLTRMLPAGWSFARGWANPHSAEHTLEALVLVYPPSLTRIRVALRAGAHGPLPAAAIELSDVRAHGGKSRRSLKRSCR